MSIKQTWNWQQEDWTEFRYDASKLEALESEFLRQSGVSAGAVKHVGDEDKEQLTISFSLLALRMAAANPVPGANDRPTLSAVPTESSRS